MSLGGQRRRFVAVIAAGLGILAAGCALPRAVLESSAPAASATQAAPAAAWEVIDGGVLGGNVVTGIEAVRFVRPVAVAARGPFVYIADEGLDRLFRYDRTLGRLQAIQDLKNIVRGEVSDIYVALDLSYYLADADGGRVLQYDRNDVLLRVVEDRMNIGRPVAVAVDEASGYMYIADGFNDDVIVYNRAGLLEGAIGVRGEGPGRFLGITALALGSGGFYVATRFGADRVQVMGPDGRYAKSFQRDSVSFPSAIAVDGARRAFVADYLEDTIKVFMDGALVDTLGGHGGAPGRFRGITDLWLDGGFLYVADSLNGRVQMLPLASSGAAPQTRNE